MNIEDKKEFLNAIVNYKSLADEEAHFMLDSVHDSVETQVKASLAKQMNIEVNAFPSGVSLDELIDNLESQGQDVMDILDYVTKTIAELEPFEHQGQTLDFTNAVEIMNEAKKSFENHKSEDDIKNF